MYCSILVAQKTRFAMMDWFQNGKRWKSTTLPALPWVVPAFASLYAKYLVMVETNAFVITARSLGVEGDFSRWQKLSFFRDDILVALVVGFALIVTARWLPRRWRIFVIGLFSGAVTLALFVQVRAFTQVGQFLSLRMLWLAIDWGLHEPGAYAAYLGVKWSLTLLTGLFLIAAVLWWLAHHGEVAILDCQPDLHVRVAGTKSVFLAAVLVATIPWMPQLPSTPYHRSILLRALEGFWDEGEVKTSEFAGLGTPELFARYRDFTHSPSPDRNPTYWGKAKGYNVIFFILESTPARFLPVDASLDDLPNIQKLRQNSFVGLQHYTTFPQTHQAYFSLFSSWYPAGVTKGVDEQHPDFELPGIMRTLSNHAYRTVAYRVFPTEENMLHALGFQQLKTYADDISSPLTTQAHPFVEWQRSRISHDLGAFELMKQDLDRFLAQKQNFAVGFFPEISHLPYPDGNQEQNGMDLSQRARAILRTEDGWLGELLQLLEQHGALQRTVIVLAGDHGIRVRSEDPTLVSGMVDEYSFHVPLLIYAPQILHGPRTIPWVTSHIDVAPTVLDLLGIEGQGRNFEQGVPIWEPKLSMRKTYFFANGLFGADGYYSDGEFYMWSHMSDSVYAGTTLHFELPNLVRQSSATHLEVFRSIASMSGLQQVLMVRFSPTSRVRNHIFDR